MLDNQRTAYMRIALGMVGVFQNDMKVETIWRIYEQLEQKKGDLALRDVAKIESQVSQKYKRKSSKPARKVKRSQLNNSVAEVDQLTDNKYGSPTLLG
jgi:hypothetical protein